MKTKNIVYLSLGSNLDREKNIKSSLNYLSASFKNLLFSPTYQSPSFGFNGNDFYNLVVKIETCFELLPLKLWLMKVEDLHGRDRNQPRYSNRTLDIDILLFNDSIIDSQEIIIPRPEILIQAYVLKPLFDITPNLIHPHTQRQISEHLKDIEEKVKSLMTVS